MKPDLIQMSVGLLLQPGLVVRALQASRAGSRRQVSLPLEGWLCDMCLPI